MTCRVYRLLLVLCLILGATSASSMDRFISPTGNDTNPGTMASPVRSLQRALQLRMPGDRIVARGGLYNLTPSASVLSQVEVVPYLGETVTLSMPDGQSFVLNASVIVWTDIRAGPDTRPDILLIRKPGTKLSNVRVTRRAGDTSTNLLITINKSTSFSERVE